MNQKINRRDFLKSITSAGIASAIAAEYAHADPNQPDPNAQKIAQLTQVPKRTLGKTNVQVSCVALGTMFNLVENQIVLRKALDWGINYWDTANSYAGGNSEKGIGKFLENNPELRKDIFIVTKASHAPTIEEKEQRLAESLKKMNTDYIDLYYGIHSLKNPIMLTNDLKEWAQSIKKRGLIKYFGFSTHKNMAQCLAAAAKLDWIDAILTTYNFRVMQEEPLQKAIEACHQAGIGLTAMKTQGLQIETNEDKKLTEHFMQKGLTAGQAKLKAVLEDKRFASVAVGMQNTALLTTNATAAIDTAPLTKNDKKFLQKYAKATCTGYCAGCAQLCDMALPDIPYVSDIMRHLMYYNSYGDKQRAKQLFAQIPENIRAKLLTADYSTAQAACPQHLPIAKFINQALVKLA